MSTKTILIQPLILIAPEHLSNVKAYLEIMGGRCTNCVVVPGKAIGMGGTSPVQIELEYEAPQNYYENIAKMYSTKKY